jgi:hypothetical protein
MFMETVFSYTLSQKRGRFPGNPRKCVRIWARPLAGKFPNVRTFTRLTLKIYREMGLDVKCFLSRPELLAYK